ncbi:MAG: tRNA (guanosine(37)-N1)-methyltransferase TrmD [Clostridiales bacterium]|nr:tRNA (guanosine(37)-N1)-methyltransferase TrmD [Clostridiales bacterium]
MGNKKTPTQFNVFTLFSNMFAPLQDSIIARAVSGGVININLINIRDFADNKHKKVDDYTFGGGTGLVMQAEPIVAAVESVSPPDDNALNVLLTPQGRKFDQSMAEFLSTQPKINLICGHYEGIDQRAIDALEPLELSLGDFVLTGGEIPAMAIIDATARCVDGVIAEQTDESFYTSALEYPQYTRPACWRGAEVESVLLSGNHKEIDKWRARESYEVTKKKRPDLLEPKKIGIIMGRFDQIGREHMELAEHGIKELNLDKVIFVPMVDVIDGAESSPAYMRARAVAEAINYNLKFEIYVGALKQGAEFSMDDMREDIARRTAGAELHWLGEEKGD